MNHLIPSDVAILDLLRKRDEMTVSNFVDSLGVTATAVRQRLTRLLENDYICRKTIAAGRGRPSHRYSLTRKGRRRTGANFADLAVALWQEIRAIKDLDIRRGLLQRIASRLAELYKGDIVGNTVEDRMQALGQIFQERHVPFSVERVTGGDENSLPVLTAHACPYPDLAEQDRSICSMERLLFSEIVGENLRLSQCRLDGAPCCTFGPANN